MPPMMAVGCRRSASLMRVQVGDRLDRRRLGDAVGGDGHQYWIRGSNNR